jgi:hypothetical protein
MICPKFKSQLERLALGEYIYFYFAIGCPKRCFHGGVLNVPKILFQKYCRKASEYGSIKEKLKVRSAPMIN